MLRYLFATLLLIAALVYVHFFAFTEAHAECAAGYHQITVPLCRPIPSCTSSSATTNQMGVLAPCSPNVVSANQVNTAALVDIGITDSNAAVPKSAIPITVQAIGLANVEVWTHGVMATRLSNAGGGEFIGTLDLSSEPAGPLHVVYNSWDVPSGGTPTIHLVGEYTLFVAGTRPAIPTPAPASGMTLAFSDHFTSLSATPCKPGTGTWPSCTQPTAADGFKWLENLWNGQDFGSCANEHTDGTHNPFTILPSGGLRIRNTFDSAYTDPYGFSRKQYCGVLSTAFKDGSNSLPTTDGYYDARVMVPNSACGSQGNNTCSGGTWPSFWMVSTNGGSNGAIELDMFEMYGNGPGYLQAFTHAYSPSFYPPGPGQSYRGNPDGDLTWDFHTIGMLVTGSGTAAGTVCSYLDEVQLGCSPMPQFGSPASATKPTWAMMLELASGGGWVTNAPPSNQYDYFVDWVGVWH